MKTIEDRNDYKYTSIRSSRVQALTLLSISQEIAASLQRGLCPRAQRPVRGHLDPGANDHLANFILRVNIASRIGQLRRHRSERLRVNVIRNVDVGHADRDVPDAEAPLRRYPKPRTGQHSSSSRADGHVHLFNVHDHRRPVYSGQAHDLGAYYGVGERCADYVSNYLHFGRVKEICRHCETDKEETG